MELYRRMYRVISSDGTPIAVWRSGAGPPLLLVHGTTADHSTTWRLVLGELERHFSVHAMDRRGRGGSGDASVYHLGREAEDIAAVIEAVGEPVNVLGHSYGALCAIEASRLTAGVRRLILYEGVPLRGADGYVEGLIDNLEELGRQGRVEEMLISMYCDIVGISAGELELMRSQRDAWAARLRNARTLPREARTEEQYVFDAARFAQHRATTLLLVGGDSPPRELSNANGVAAALRDGHVLVMPGQQHVAMHTAPELFARAVVEFLSS